MDLLFCIDKSHIPLLQSCLFSIARSGGAPAYDAYVLHSDLTAADRQAVQAGLPAAVTAHFFEVDAALFEGFPESSRYPRQIYYRLIAPLLLPTTLERVLYLDVDIVVINPLTTLYETSFDGAWYVACTHTGELLTKFNQMRLETDEETPYINTGVLLLNLPALRQKLDVQAIEAYARLNSRALMLPDQDILTALYGDKVKLADPLRYNLSDRTLLRHNLKPGAEKLDLDWVRKNTAIVHYIGKNKPWKKGYVGVLDVFWQELMRDRERAAG